PVSRLPAIWWELMLTEGAQTVRKVFAKGRYHCIELRMRLRYCFALFKTLDDAQEAAADLKNQHPDWWIAATELGG
ncbi:MAG: hypothetical protein AAF950_12770, partial [Pseudomonadota bacterium]